MAMIRHKTVPSSGLPTLPSPGMPRRGPVPSGSSTALIGADTLGRAQPAERPTNHGAACHRSCSFSSFAIKTWIAWAFCRFGVVEVQRTELVVSQEPMVRVGIVLDMNQGARGGRADGTGTPQRTRRDRPDHQRQSQSLPRSPVETPACRQLVFHDRSALTPASLWERSSRGREKWSPRGAAS